MHRARCCVAGRERSTSRLQQYWLPLSTRFFGFWTNQCARTIVRLACFQLEEIDHGANAHVETLARLDLVKTNMDNCLHTLTEAASWNALVRQVNAR